MSESDLTTEPVLDPPTDVHIDPEFLERDTALTSDPEEQTPDAALDGNPGEGGAG